MEASARKEAVLIKCADRHEEEQQKNAVIRALRVHRACAHAFALYRKRFVRESRRRCRTKCEGSDCLTVMKIIREVLLLHKTSGVRVCN